MIFTDRECVSLTHLFIHAFPLHGLLTIYSTFEPIAQKSPFFITWPLVMPISYLGISLSLFLGTARQHYLEVLHMLMIDKD